MTRPALTLSQHREEVLEIARRRSSGTRIDSTPSMPTLRHHADPQDFRTADSRQA